MDLREAAAFFSGLTGVLAGMLVLVDVYTQGAVFELIAVLLDAWQEADVRRRLAAWWWVTMHRHLLDGPPPSEGGAS